MAAIVGPGHVAGIADGWAGINASGQSNGWEAYDVEETPENHVPISLWADAQVPCVVPVNLRVTGVQTNSPVVGALTYSLAWDSSSGNLSDLAQCSVGEFVQYPGGGGSYAWPVPFPDVTSPNPTVVLPPPPSATSGLAGDTHWPGTPENQRFRTSEWQSNSFAATQHYGYTCQCTGATTFRSLDPWVNMTVLRETTTEAATGWTYHMQKLSDHAYIYNIDDPLLARVFRAPRNFWATMTEALER